MRNKLVLLIVLAAIFVSPAYAEELKPTLDQALLRLKVQNSLKKPVKGTIVSVRDEKDNRVVSAVTDEKGIVEALVPKGKTYHVKFVTIASKKTETKKEIVVPDRTFYKFTLQLTYNPVIAKNYILRGVNFDTGKATLKKSSYPYLADLVEYMTVKTACVIELSGHTDDVGDDEDNRVLSEDRAKAVRDYLVSKGVDAKRIIPKGYGESQPIAPNKSPEGRRVNRRTEVRIIKE